MARKFIVVDPRVSAALGLSASEIAKMTAGQFCEAALKAGFEIDVGSRRSPTGQGRLVIRMADNAAPDQDVTR